MTFPSQPQPDPTRGFPAPPPYDPTQAPPVVSGYPNQPAQAYPPPGQPYGQPVQPYGAPPPGYPPPPQPPKKGMSSGKIVALIVAAFAGLCLVGGVVNAVAGTDSKSAGVATKAPAPQAAKAQPTTAQPTDDEDPPTEDPADDADAHFNLKPGTTLTLTGDDGSVQDTTIVSFKQRKGACDQFATDPENGIYLIAEVRVVQKKGTGSVNPLFFEFVGDDGTTSNAIGGAFSGCAKNDLTSTNSLRSGSKRSGQVVFDVKSAKGTVELTPGLISETAGSWRSA